MHTKENACVSCVLLMLNGGPLVRHIQTGCMDIASNNRILLLYACFVGLLFWRRSFPYDVQPRILTISCTQLAIMEKNMCKYIIKCSFDCTTLNQLPLCKHSGTLSSEQILRLFYLLNVLLVKSFPGVF